MTIVQSAHTTESTVHDDSTRGPAPAAPLVLAVVGMGYVGLTLAAALADAGHIVHGVDSNDAVLASLRAAQPHIHEPGLDDVFATLTGTHIFPSRALPECPVDAVILAVSTPVDPQSHEPRLENLADAAAETARHCAPGTLVVVRSTVPIGTTRGVVLPVLREHWGEDVLLCFAPERTIQGQALRELVDLPQVVAGLDDRSASAGVDLFRRLAKNVVRVSSIETAEMVKLANNCHTDLIYGFGNEVALIAEQHGIDPLEVIRAANLDYPRPDLSKPGFVGGACLTKDPYHLLHGTTQPEPFLISRARELNEYLPVHVARTVIDMIRRTRGMTEGSRLGVLGWACKGWPPTDDMRGTAIEPMIPLFREAGIDVLGEDPEVRGEVIAQFGGRPVTREEAIRFSDGLLVLNDHPAYVGLDVVGIAGEYPPKFVFDAWRILDEQVLSAAGIRYAGIGYRGRA